MQASVSLFGPRLDFPQSGSDTHNDESTTRVLQCHGMKSIHRHDRRLSVRTAEERQERARERNRTAQARYRQKQKEQCERIKEQMQQLRDRKAQAEAFRDDLQEKRNALIDRFLAHPMPAKPSTLGTAVTHARKPPALQLPNKNDVDPLGNFTSTPNHDALTQMRHTSASLYAPRYVIPPPISSFRHCAPITYEHLLKASGSSSRLINFSHMGLFDVVQAAQAAVVQRLGCTQGEVCWFVQSHYEAAPGVPLSFSTSLSSPECVASLVLVSIMAQLEAAVLGLPDNPEEFCAASRHGSLSSESARAAAPDPAQDPCTDHEPVSKCVRLKPENTDGGDTANYMHAPHAHDLAGNCHGGGADADGAGATDGGDPAQDDEFVAWLGSAFDSDSEGGPIAAGEPGQGWGGDCDGASKAGGATSASPLMLRCGVTDVFDGLSAVRSVMRQVVRSAKRHRVADTVAVLRLVKACADSASDVVETFNGDAGAGGGGDSAHGGSAPEGESRPQTFMDAPGFAAATSSASDSISHDGRDRKSSIHKSGAQVGASGFSASSDATGVFTEDFFRRCSVSDCAGGDDSGGEASRPGCVPRGESAAGGEAAVKTEEAALAAYHMALTRTLCDMLLGVCDVCQEVCEGWGTASAQADSDLEAAAARAEETRHERLFVALTELCLGHTLSMRDAGRVMRGMAANSIPRSLLHYEMENAHVLFYRDLRLAPDQVARMAAWWHSWLARKRSLDDTAGAARNALDSLPDSLAIPGAHLRHIAQLAAGAPQPHTCSACTPQQPDVCRWQSCAFADMHRPHACGSNGVPQCNSAGTCAGGVAGVQMSARDGGGACVCCACCGGPVCAEHALVGGDAAATCRAADAIRLLQRLQEADGALSLAAMPMHQQPGVLLQAEQLAAQSVKNLEHGCPKVDSLLLCQLAATQVRRQELRRWPAVLGQPLPGRM